MIEVRQTKNRPPVFEVRHESWVGPRAVEVASEVLGTKVDLLPFYAKASRHRKLAPVVKALWGLRPLRPASLFEMLITAITEQQISMRIALLMRERIAARFGERVGDTLVFPDEEILSKASRQSLLRCGLSRSKAEYVLGLSKMVSSGRLDLEGLKRMSDDEAYAVLTQIRGVGPWTADYLLVRGLGRADRVPVDDLGVRSVVGRYLGSGERIEDSREVAPLLRPFAPYRGLAAYYLLVYHRIGAATQASR